MKYDFLNFLVKTKILDSCTKTNGWNVILYDAIIYLLITQYDVVVILYWGDAFLSGNNNHKETRHLNKV